MSNELAEDIEQTNVGSSPKRTYQCERIARQHLDHQCKRIALQHPDRWWFGFMGDAPRSPEEEADAEAIDTIVADLDAAGQLPGEYDPSPGTSFEDLSLAQRRLVLEQRLTRATILRKEADARVARRREKLPAGWREPMPLKTVMQRNAREKWIVAGRVARRLTQVELAAKAALDALPKRCPSTLTFPGRDVATGTSSAREQYKYLDKPRPPAKVPVNRSSKHGFWSARRRCQCIAWGVVVIFALQFYIGILESMPPSYQPAAASAGEPTVFAFLNHTQIVNDEDGSFLLWANGSVYFIAEIGGPDDPWGGDMAEFSFEEIDSDLPGEQYYSCTTGLHSWAYQLPDEMTLCNLTIPDWCRSRFTSLSVQPLYIAQGEVNATRTAPAQVVFNATGDIAILLWTMGNFSDLAVTLDGATLKANTYENLRHMSIAVAQDVFDSEWLQFPARVPTGQHDLEIWGEFNQTIYYTCVHGTADFDEDLLLDYEEMMSASSGLCPEIANLWGYQYVIGQVNDTSIEDIVTGNDDGYWAPESISFYIPDDHVVESYDPLSDDDGSTMELKIIDWNGQYTNFAIDGDSACLANVTLAGYTGSEYTPRTIIDSEGEELGTFMDYQLIFPSIVSCEIAGPGWHTLSYKVLYGTSVTPDLELSIDGQVVYLSSVYPDVAGADADGDTVPDDTDRSPADYLSWRKDTLLQLTVPCMRTSSEDVKIDIDVVRGPEDPDPSKELIWHGGEVGERKVRLVQAMILYGPGDNAPSQGLSDYWNTLNELQIFMNNSQYPWQVDTYNLIDKDGFGFSNDSAITGDCDPLPQNGTTAYDYQMLLMPEQATNVSSYTLCYPSDHPAIQNDSVIVLRLRFVIAIVAEDSNLLGFYDYPAGINISAIVINYLSGVNGLLGEPRDASENLILWALNMNPGVATDWSSEWDTEIDRAVVDDFSSAHFLTQYNYDCLDNTTLGAMERLIYARNQTKWDNMSAEVTYLTSTTRTLDLLSKINQSIKFDLVTGEQYCVYPQQYDFSQLGSGLEFDTSDPIISGWECSQGSGHIDMLRNVQTRADVVSLHADGVGTTMQLDAGASNTTGTITFSLFLNLVGDKIEIRFGEDDTPDAFALVVERESEYSDKMWVSYRAPDLSVIKLCEVWLGEWFSFEVWFDDGANSYLSPNCSTWDVFMDGAMQYAAINLPSWNSWDSIQYVDFVVSGGRTIELDGFGFYAGQFGADAEFSCTSPETVHFGDSRTRSSFYTVSDVYNGTFVYGDPQLEGNEVTLWSTDYSALQHLMERAVVDTWPMEVHVQRVNDSLFDGFEVDQFLNMSFASGPEIAAADLPEAPGASFTWQGQNVPVATVFQHLLINEWVTEDVEGVPATICFYTGDEVRWEFDWRVGEVDPWAVYCTRHCESLQAIMRNKRLFEALLPFEKAKKVAEEYLKKCKDGAKTDFYYENLIPCFARPREDYLLDNLYVKPPSEGVDPILNFIRDPVSRQNTIDNYEAYIAGFERILTLISMSGNEMVTVPRVIREVFAKDDLYADVRLSDEFIASLPEGEEALKAQGFEILAPGICPNSNTEYLGRGKIAQNYWKMVYTKVRWGDVLDAYRSFVLAIVSEGFFRVIGAARSWDTFVGKTTVGGDSPLDYAIGMPGEPTMIWIDWQTLDVIWGDLPPLDAPEWKITRDGKMYINYYEYAMNRNWAPTGGKVLPRTGAYLGGEWVTFALGHFKQYPSGIPTVFDICYDPSISDEILASHPVTYKDPNSNNAAMVYFNRFQRKVASEGRTAIGGLARLFKNLKIFSDPRTPSEYFVEGEALRHALEGIAKVPEGASLKRIIIQNSKMQKRFERGKTALAQGYRALTQGMFPAINLRAAYEKVSPFLGIWDQLFPVSYNSYLGPDRFSVLSGRAYYHHVKDWHNTYKKADMWLRGYLFDLEAASRAPTNRRNVMIARVTRALHSHLWSLFRGMPKSLKEEWSTIKREALGLPTGGQMQFFKAIMTKMGIPFPKYLMGKAEKTKRLKDQFDRYKVVTQNWPEEEGTAKFVLAKTDAMPGEEASSPCYFVSQGPVQSNPNGILGFDSSLMGHHGWVPDPSDVVVRLTWELIDKDGKVVKTTDSVKEMMEWEGDVKCITSVYERIHRYTSSYVFWQYSEAENEEYDEWIQWVAMYCPPPGEDERIPPELIAQGCVAGALGFAPYCGRLIGAMTFSLFSNLLCSAALGASGNTMTAAASYLGDAIQSVSSDPNNFATLMAAAPAEAEAVAAGGGGGTFSYSNWLQNPPKAGDVAASASQGNPGIADLNYNPGGVKVAETAAEEVGGSFKKLEKLRADLQDLDKMAEVQAETLAKQIRLLKIAAFLSAVFLVISVISLVLDIQNGADPVTIGLDIYAVASSAVGLAAVLAVWYVVAAGAAATAFATGVAIGLSALSMVFSYIGMAVTAIIGVLYVFSSYLHVLEGALSSYSVSLDSKLSSPAFVRHGGFLVNDQLSLTITVSNTGYFHWDDIDGLFIPLSDTTGAPFWWRTDFTIGQLTDEFDWSQNSGWNNDIWSDDTIDWNSFGDFYGTPEYDGTNVLYPQMDGEFCISGDWRRYNNYACPSATPDSPVTYSQTLTATAPATQLGFEVGYQIATSLDGRHELDPDTLVSATLFGDENEDGFIDPLYETPTAVIEGNLTAFTAACEDVNTTTPLDEIIQKINQACANYQWLDAANNASILQSIASDTVVMPEWKFDQLVVDRLRSLTRGENQRWYNYSSEEFQDRNISAYIADNYYLLQTSGVEEFHGWFSGNLGLDVVAGGWRAAQPAWWANPSGPTEHWWAYDYTDPAGQIFVPKAWVEQMSQAYDANATCANFADQIPCLTNIHAVPSWSEIPVIMPGEVLSGALEFTYEGTDNPTVAYTLTPPYGWGISSSGGTSSLLSITEIPFSLTVPVDAPAGVYYIAFNESLAGGSTKAGNTTFACVLPIRIYQNASYYLGVDGLPAVMKAGSVYDWARLFNSGTQPHQLVVTGDGVPSDWLTADGFAPVMVWDFTAPTCDWGYAGGTSAITGGALTLQSSAAERVSANVSLEAELHPGDRIHVIYDNDGAVNPVLGAWDSFALSGNGLQVRTFVIDAFETLDGLVLSANVSASTSFRVTHLSIDRALTRYSPLSQLVFAGVSADVGDWGWNASFGSGESTMWFQAPVTNATFVNSNSPTTNYNNLGYLRTYYAPNGAPAYDYASYVGVPLIEDVVGPMGYQEFGSASRYLAGWRYANMIGSAEDFVAYGCESFDEATLTWNTMPASYPTPISSLGYRVFDEEWVPDPELAETHAYAWDLSDSLDRFVFVNTSIDGNIITIYDDESSVYGGKERPYVAIGVPKVGINFDSLVIQSDTAETFEFSHDLAEGGQPVTLAVGDEVWVNFASVLSSQVTLTLVNTNPAQNLVFVLDTGNGAVQENVLKNFVIPVAGEFTALKISGILAPAENFSLYFAGVYKYQPNGVSFAEMDIGGFFAESIAPAAFTTSVPSVYSEVAGHQDVLAIQGPASGAYPALYSLDNYTGFGNYTALYSFDKDTVGNMPAGWTKSVINGQVAAAQASHSKVFKIIGGGSAGSVTNSFTSKTSGTVEFWLFMPTGAAQATFNIGSQDNVILQFNADGTIKYVNSGGSAVQIGTFQFNTWFHMLVYFDFSPDKFTVYRNGTVLGTNLGMKKTGSSASNIYFKTTSATFYADAVDYSWATSYSNSRNRGCWTLPDFPTFYGYRTCNASVTVQEQYAGHDNVLNIASAGGNSTGFYNQFTSAQTTGVVEFWVAPAVSNNNLSIYLNASTGTAGFGLFLDAGNNIVTYPNAVWTDTGYDFVPNQWMHLRIEFNTTSDTYSVYKNGLLIVNNTLCIQNVANIAKFQVLGLSSSIYNASFDAIDYSWAPNYIGWRSLYGTVANYTFPSSQTQGRLDFCVYAPGTDGTLWITLDGANGTGIQLAIANYQLWCGNNSGPVAPISIYGGWHQFSIGWNCSRHNYTVWYFNQTVYQANYTGNTGILNFSAGAITGVRFGNNSNRGVYCIDGVYRDPVYHPPTNESLVALNHTGAGYLLTMKPGEEWVLRCAPKVPQNYSYVHLSIYDGGQLVGLAHQNVSVNCPPVAAHQAAYSYVTGVTTNKSINWTILDSCGICANATWKMLRNGTQISNGSWASSPKYVNVTTRDQSSGLYIYELWVDDGYTGNQLLDNTTVTVLDQPPAGQSCANYSYATFETYNKFAYWNITINGTIYAGATWEVRLGTQVVNSGSWTKSGELAYAWTGNQAPSSYIYSCYACHGNDQEFHKVGGDVNVTAYNAALPSSSHPADCSFWTGRESATLQWALNDTGIMTGAGRYEVYRNDTVPFKVASGVFTCNGQGVSYIVENLPPRAYNFSLYVTDGMSGMIWVDNITVWANNTTPTSNEVSDYEYITYIDLDKQIEWTVTDLGAIHTTKAKIQVRLNGIVNFTLDFDTSSQVVVVPTCNQMIEVYNYTLWVDDGYTGFLMLDEVQVTADNAPPWSSSPADYSYYDNDWSKNITWIITDLYGIGVGTWQVYLNGSVNATGTWDVSGATVTINTTGQAPGVYVYTLKVNDSYSILRDVDTVYVSSFDDDTAGPEVQVHFFGGDYDSSTLLWIVSVASDPSGIASFDVYMDDYWVGNQAGSYDLKSWSWGNMPGWHHCDVVVKDNDMDHGAADQSVTVATASKYVTDDDTSGPTINYRGHIYYWPLYTYCWFDINDPYPNSGLWGMGVRWTIGHTQWQETSLGWDETNECWYAMVWGDWEPHDVWAYDYDNDWNGDRTMTALYLY